MRNNIKSLTKNYAFKIVFRYAIISITYTYSIHYLIKEFISNPKLFAIIQTHEDTIFILITSLFLYLLIRKHINEIHSNDRQIIDIEEKTNKEYFDLFNVSPIPKWLFDIETLDFLVVNDAACAKYGYSKEEFASMNLRDLHLKEQIDGLEKALASALKDGSHSEELIKSHLKKNGEIIKVKIEAKNVPYKGKIVKLAYIIDLTTEINTQKTLIETNSKLQLASKIASLGYWTNDLVKSEIQWSDEVYKIFELNPETFELTLDNIINCYHPDSIFEFDSNLSFSFESNNTKESERRIITGSGKIKWVLERINLICDENGKPIKLDGIVIDITNRKLHEQEIIESNKRFKTLAKATNEAIIDWDIKNDTVIWGEGFQTLFGYDLSVDDYYLWSSNIHPEDKEKVLAGFNKTIEDPTKEIFTAKFRFLKANREVTYVQYKNVLIRDANGKAIRALASMIDLTETLDKLQKIEIQNKKLQDIAWMQSHEVRSPLSNIMGLVNLLKTNLNLDGDDENSKIISYITESTQKLDEIIHDIVGKTSELDKEKEG